MIQYPHCKINLGLSIVAKRADGFHELETVFYPVALKDILEITPAKTNDATSFSNSGLAIPGDSINNLCLKAYHLLKADFPSLPEIQMHLHKIIPMGAGLGGGSSDGSSALKILNTLFEIGLSQEQLIIYAEKLGSDCPFFIANQPALAKGRGEQLHPMNVNLSGLYIAIYNPGIHVSTASAYGSIVPNPMHSIDYQIKALHEWQAYYVNDFEKPVALAHPEISEGIEYLTEKGAFYAAMSGSGSSYLGIFENPPSNLTTNGLLYVGPVSLSS